MKPFPLQAAFFDDLPEDQLEALADDIRRNGLRRRVEILPDGTVVSGHQRLRALKLLGRTSAEALVRYDLAGDPTAAEREFLEQNQNRRQMDKLAQARVAVRLLEIEKGKPAGAGLRSYEDEARERVGKRLGMSGRTLSRYIAVLKAPPSVQDAFRAGVLRLTSACRVAGLDRDVVTQIDRRLRNGEVAQAVVDEFMPHGERRQRRPADAVAALLRGLRRGMDDLRGRVDQVPPRLVERHADDLRKARKMLTMLLDLCAAQ